MAVRIEALDSMRLVAMFHQGPYHEIGKVWDKMNEWAAHHEVQGHRYMSLFHDDPERIPPDKLRSHAAIEVNEDFPARDGVEIIEHPGGLYAVYRHEGPYSELPKAWAHFCSVEIPNAEHEYGKGSTFEIYLNDPRTTPPEKLITELYCPIRES